MNKNTLKTCKLQEKRLVFKLKEDPLKNEPSEENK
jgi:hypothetical protein